MKFLIVDDESLSIRKLVRILKKLYPEAEIVSTEDPLKALEYQNELFSAAFLDIEMPQMTGVELASKLLAANPRLNIIFETAYNTFAVKAYQLHASGYLLKPYSLEEVEAELQHVRYPLEAENVAMESPAEEKQSGEPSLPASHIRIQCFGYFEVFDHEKTIKFERKPSKEILAYLVHMRGASVSRLDISNAIWEDSVEIERKKGYFRSLITSLKNTLREHNAEMLLDFSRDSFSFCAEGADVDLYRYLQGDKDPEVQFHGIYMSQYSWAEYAVAGLDEEE